MEQSNNQVRFLLIKILDPGRKRFYRKPLYRRHVCDCPLEFKLWWTDTSGFSTEFASGHYEYTSAVFLPLLTSFKCVLFPALLVFL